MSIPRAQIGLSYGEIIRFMWETCLPVPHEKSENTISSFENTFTARYGDNFSGVVCCKARMALFHILKEMDLSPGSEVVISAIHVADFVNIINLAGFKPVVVDLSKGGYDIDCEDLSRKISSATKVILVTHLSGYPCSMNKIIKIANIHNIHIIEDCSQAFKAYHNGQKIGTFGYAAIFSLSLLKSVCTISGGMIISQDLELISRLRKRISCLKNPNKISLIKETIKNLALKILLSRLIFSFCVFPSLKIFTLIGVDQFSKFQKTNKNVVLRDYMPDEFLTRFTYSQANLGLSQLKSLEDRENRRINLGRELKEAIYKNFKFILPIFSEKNENCFWLFPILLDRSNKIKIALAKAGIDSSKMLLSVLSKEEEFKKFDFKSPNAEKLHKQTLFLPLYDGLDNEDIEKIKTVVFQNTINEKKKL